MRCLPILLIALLATVGCTRDDGAAVPDRGGHAYRVDGVSTTGSTQDMVSSAPDPEPGETTVVFESGDRLYRIADDYGVSLRWLIRRNDLVGHPPSPGDELIVPRR